MRLSILHAVLALRVALGDADLVIREAVLVEDLLDDLDRRKVLEDSAVARQRQEPEPRHHVGAIGRQAIRAAKLHEPAHAAVNHPRPAIRELNVDRDRLTDERVRRNVVRLRHHLEREVERRRDGFLAGEALEEQLVGTERRCHRERPTGLGE
jgi:hypothetical protein